MSKPRDRETIDGIVHLRCGGCKNMLPEKLFSLLKSGRRHTYCKKCNAACTRQSQRNKRFANGAKERPNRQWFLEAMLRLRAAAKAHGIPFANAAAQACELWIEAHPLPEDVPLHPVEEDLNALAPNKESVP